MSGDDVTADWPSLWGHGLPPLRQSVAYAAAVRSLTEAVLALDAPSDELDELIDAIRRTDEKLRASSAVTPKLRMGSHADDPTRRPYLDHSMHPGWYNPVFPDYTIDTLTPERATGTVRFPTVYEGPPGYVHGGFIAVFFDVVTGHQSSQVGVAGKTKSLETRYRRPTPLDVTLRFEIDRRVDGREIVSDAVLLDGDTVLCTAQARNVVSSSDGLPAVGARLSRQPGPRRSL